MRTAQDFADYIEYSGLGEKARDVFTSADVGAYENRALFVTVKETQSSKAPDVTINADYINLNVKIQGNYGKNGENRVLDKAMAIYRLFHLKTDLVINGHTYHYIQALNPPIHTGFDAETGISTYEFNCEIFRRLN